MGQVWRHATGWHIVRRVDMLLQEHTNDLNEHLLQRVDCAGLVGGRRLRSICDTTGDYHGLQWRLKSYRVRIHCGERVIHAHGKRLSSREIGRSPWGGPRLIGWDRTLSICASLSTTWKIEHHLLYFGNENRFIVDSVPGSFVVRQFRRVNISQCLCTLQKSATPGANLLDYFPGNLALVFSSGDSGIFLKPLLDQ